MPSKAPRHAVEVYRYGLRRIAGCATDRPMLATGHDPKRGPYHVSFVPLTQSVPLRLLGGAPGPKLSVEVNYRVIEEVGGTYDVQTVGYSYRILEREGREILVYHWHPRSVSPIATPHLHLSTRIPPFNVAPESRIALGEMHIPTGLVTLAQVVRLLISEFGVEPRRDDWAAVLRDVEEPSFSL